MKFKNWLERKEVDLYHGTTTGDDEKNLKSFNQGIKPKSSSGHGQGAGYYAYSDKEYAKNHAQSLLGGSSPKTFQQHSGNPMVVTHKSILNPKEYELDKEIQSADIFNFFRSNEDYISGLLKKNPITVDPSNYDDVSIAKPFKMYGFFYWPKYKAIGVWVVDPTKIDTSQAKSHVDYYVFMPNNVNDAADLNLIMNKLFESFPELGQKYKSFSRVLMKRASEGRLKNKAWKYVGDKPIQPDRLMVKSNDGWVDKSDKKMG